MKKFVVKSFLFAALVVGVIGGVCALEIFAEIRAYRREVVAPPAASILVCGDSQLGNSVDPQVCPEFFNFSAHGRSLDQSYLAAIDLLRGNSGGRIRTIVLDAYPAGATISFSCGMNDMEFAGKYWLLHYLHPDETIRSLHSGLIVARDNLVGRRLRHFWRAARGKVEFHSSLEGKYTPSFEVIRRVSPAAFDGIARKKAGEAKGAADVGPDSPCFAVLDDMARLAAGEGVEMVLVTTPWHPDLIALCGEAELDRFVASVSAWAAKRGVRYVSFLKERFPEECWLDANHLNANGAKLFTPMLLNAVRGENLL